MLCLETEVSLCRLHPSFAAGVSRFQTLGTNSVHLQEQPCGVVVVVVVGESQIQTSNW